MTEEERKASLENTFIVGYDHEVQFVTTNRHLADEESKELDDQFPILGFGVRNVKQAMQDAYESGFDDGRSCNG